MKKFIKLMMLFVLCLSVAGCDTNKENNKENANATTYPMTIVDQLGREVVIEKEPQRIVSGYYISTSTLLALDETANLVGIEDSADKRPIYAMVDENLLSLPAMGTVKTFDIEKCMTLDADVVILPFKLSAIAKSLEDLGISVVYVMPESETLLQEMVTLLGKITNNTKRADEMVKCMQNILSEVETKVKDEVKPKVYLGGNSSILSTSGANMYQHSLIENAGGINVASSLEDTYWAEVSYEQILIWDPEYIVLAADAAYSVEDVLNNPSLQACSAIRNKKVFRLPNDIECWDSPLPSSVLGVSYIASILHEDVYGKDTYEKTKQQFYQTFYNVEIK